MPKSSRYIKDSVHGDFSLNEFEFKVMDSPQIQRLRRIKQLGFISLIYPGANHSRFEHSIGTMYLGSKLANHLELSNDEKELVRISAFLHDAGHGPFSHVSESVLNARHEELTAEIIKKTSLNDILSSKFDTNEIIDIINGKGYLGPIVSGELDVDRMDYLIRDSHHTGVAYGVIDADRIIDNMKLEKYLLLNIKGVQAAESALVARYFMYPSVYQHHTTRIVNAMFRRSFKIAIDNKILTDKKMYEYDDYDIINIYRNEEGYIKDIINRLDNRNLFKTLSSIRLNQFENPQEIFNNIKKKDLRKAEEEISEKYDLDKNYVFLNIAEYPKFDEMKTQVFDGEEIYHLSEISSIVAALKTARFNYPDISLYIPKEYGDKIERFRFEDYLNLPEIAKGKFDKIHMRQAKLFE